MKHIFTFFLCAVFGFSALYSASASAQLVPVSPEVYIEKKMPQNYDYSKIPDEYFEEADAFYDRCSADLNYNQYYDCGCLSTAYLNKRIIYEDEITGQSIELKIKNQCRDATGVIGKIYTDCLNLVDHFKPGTDPEKLCSCSANTYVASMNRLQPPLTMSTRTSIRAKSHNACLRKFNYQ